MEKKNDVNGTAGLESNKMFISNITDYGFGREDYPFTSNLQLDIESVINILDRYFSSKRMKFSPHQDYISLLEEGALYIPMVFEANDQFFSVFFIYTTEDAKKYLDALDKITLTPYDMPVYFSIFDFGEIKEKTLCTRTLKLADLKYRKNIPVMGEYAMWWADADEARFLTSDTYQILYHLYQVFKQYETVHMGYLLEQIGLIEDIGRAELPEQEKALTVIGPELKKILIVLSREKGIRFLFPVQTTNRFYREQFLHAVGIDFLTFRLSLQQQGIEKDDYSVTGPLEWFVGLSKQYAEIEGNGNESQRFGSEEILFL